MTLLRVRDLHVEFQVHQNKKWPWSAPQTLRAVNGVSFDLKGGKTLGVVGESGCGKSTLIRAIAGLVNPSGGQVEYDGNAIKYNDRSAVLAARRKMQMIFQDPVASLNPRMNIREIVAEPLKVMGIEGDHKTLTKQMLDRVGIAERNHNRYPHEFSGGQCQRIGIARALITQPKLLLCDEPVSALDVSIQAQVVNLLKELQRDMDLTLVFVAHDLGIVHHISDEILVMYLGGKMEYAAASQVVKAPAHPYSQALLSAVPVPNPRLKINPKVLGGDLPSPLNLPKGCLFSTRCPQADALCKSSRPELREFDGRQVSCHKVE